MMGASGCNCLFFAVVDLEECRQLGNVKDLPERCVQSEQDEPRAGILRGFQSLDQRCETRAVHIPDRGQIDDHPCPAPLLNLVQERLAQFRRGCEVDVPRNVEDGDLARPARRYFHCRYSSGVPGGPPDTEKSHESEPIPACCSAEFYRIHVLPDEMKSQATRPHVLERPPAQLP